ncbi:MAG: PEP-CTERM sorting domain-containing protein, partial [Chthoniobacterales bacterium]
FTTAGTLILNNASIFNNAGTTSATAGFQINNSAQFNNQSGGSFSTGGLTLANTTSISNAGTIAFSGALVANGTNVITNSGGTYSSNGITLNGTAGIASSFVASGGTMNVTSDLRVHNGSFTLSGANVTATIVAFDDAGNSSGHLNINSGSLTITRPDFGIFRSGGTQTVNFSLNSTGSLSFTQIGNAENLIFGGLITLNDITYTNLNYTTVFNVTHPTGTSTLITLVATVPEPSTYAAIIGAACFGLIALRRRRMARVS